MKNLRKVSLAATILAGAMLFPATAMAQERPSYTTKEVSSGALTDNIVFNSVSDGWIGDERDFVRAIRDSDNQAGTWHGDVINVNEDGAIYEVFLYVHNDNPSQNATSENTEASIVIPEGIGKELEIVGTITAGNATPGEYHDSITFVSDHEFRLEYVYASDEAVDAQTMQTTMASFDYSIVGDERGLVSGYNSPDGKMPGGLEQFVCLRVKAIFYHECEVETKVRMRGADEWQDEIEAKVGDEVEYQIRLLNTDGETINNVSFLNLNSCPDLEYIPGTAKYHTSLDPNPKDLEERQVNELFSYQGGNLSECSSGVNLGDCLNDSEIVLTYAAKIANVDLEPGKNPLGSWVQISAGEERYRNCMMIYVRHWSKFAMAAFVVCCIALVFSVLRLAIGCRQFYKSAKKG